MTVAGGARTSPLDALLLSLWRGALAGAVFVSLPALLTGAAWILFYALPVAVVIGAAMGAVCAPLVWRILHSGWSLLAAAFIAALAAAAAWVAAVLVVLLVSGSEPTGLWVVFAVAPTPVGAAAAAWTLVTLHRRLT